MIFDTHEWTWTCQLGAAESGHKGSATGPHKGRGSQGRVRAGRWEDAMPWRLASIKKNIYT